MGWLRALVGIALAFVALSMVASIIGTIMMAPGGSGVFGRLLFAALLVFLVAKLVRPRREGSPQRAYQQSPHHQSPQNRRSASEYRSVTPEEILRERFARGELSRDQYRESIVEMLKDRYVRDELTLEEYEARVNAVMDVGRPSRNGSEAPQEAAFR